MYTCLHTEDPVVLKGPDSVVVGLLDDTTNQPTFTCMVGGTREPTLFWTYIPSLDDGRLHIFSGGNYGILSNRTREDNGRYVVTSTLTFLSVTNTDGGIVTCNTGSDPNIIHADALLTVLGMSKVVCQMCSWYVHRLASLPDHACVMSLHNKRIV